MHEMSIAMSIIELATSKAQAAGAQKINHIEVEVGTLSGVLVDSLVFCFEAAAKNTAADGAKIEVIEVAAMGRCVSCNHEFLAGSLAEPCPKCGEYLVNITGGRELKVLSLTVDE